MDIRLLLGLTFMSAILLIPLAGAKNYDVTDSKRIDPGWYNEYYITGLKAGDNIEITVTVTAGGNIDVMLMDTPNFSKFTTAVERQEGSWINYDEDENTRMATIITVALEDGDYILVIDNSHQPEGGAESGDYVDVDIKIKTWSDEVSSDSGGGACGGVVILPMLAIGAILVLLYIKRK